MAELSLGAEGAKRELNYQFSMLKKTHRVPVGGFPRNSKVVFSGKCAVLKTAKNSLTYSRVGVVVGKNSVGGAIKRNRAKRVVFNVFRDNKGLLSRPGTDYLVIVSLQRSLDDRVDGELTKELGNAISKLIQTQK